MLLTFACCVVCLHSQVIYWHKFLNAAWSRSDFISLLCLVAQRKGMVINMNNSFEMIMSAGTPVNIKEKSAEDYAKDAELGDIEAKFELGRCYEHGKGVPKDYIKAAELYIEVAECENREKFTCSDPDCPCVYPQYEAEYALGCFNEQGLLPDSTMEKAIEWYLRAQNDGSNEADWKMVECYLLGKGVEQNLDAAAENLYNSAHHWSNGHDVRSFTLAKALDGKTETHQLQICEILAECYLNGVGTDRDEEKALEYQKKAEALKVELEAEAQAWAEKCKKHKKAHHQIMAKSCFEERNGHKYGIAN